MITASIDILSKFQQSVSDCRALFFHCINRIDTHTNAGIEASFLQFVKSFETFLEDSTLAFLCSEVPLTLTTSLIEPRFTLNNFEDVRAIIYNGQAYTEWLKVEKLLNRYRTFFTVDLNNENRLTMAIKHNISLIQNILTIRNEIAHSSFATNKQIKRIYSEFDPLKIFNRPAEYLIEHSKEEPNKLNFIYYLDMIELTSIEIIG